MLENFGNPNFIVPTPPTGDSSKRVANTEFVALAINSATTIRTVKQTIFTASGTYTATANMVWVVIECYGGGGGGGGCSSAAANAGVVAGGGQAGGYSQTLASTGSVGVSQTVTIGIAGVAGTGGNNPGGNGGSTSVGSLCIAVGGLGGSGSDGAITAPVAGGAGTVTGTGDITVVGAWGQPGYAMVGSSSRSAGGAGGSSPIGSGGQTLPSATRINGSTAQGFAAGGSGGQSFNAGGVATGGTGSAGFIRIVEYIA